MPKLLHCVVALSSLTFACASAPPPAAAQADAPSSVSAPAASVESSSASSITATTSASGGRVHAKEDLDAAAKLVSSSEPWSTALPKLKKLLGEPLFSIAGAAYQGSIGDQYHWTAPHGDGSCDDLSILLKRDKNEVSLVEVASLPSTEQIVPPTGPSYVACTGRKLK